MPTSIKRRRLKRPLSPLVPLLLGLTCIGGAVGLLRQRQALQRADVHDIAKLRTELDSVRAVVARTPGGLDSTRLAQSVAQRTYMLGRREFHVPTRQESIDQWWTLRGPGTVLVLVGILFIALAVGTRLRARAA